MWEMREEGRGGGRERDREGEGREGGNPNTGCIFQMGSN